MNPRTPSEIPTDLDLDAADAEAHDLHVLSIELANALASISELEGAAETDAERNRLAQERAELELEHASAELRKRSAELRLQTARANSQEQEILRTLINTPAPLRTIVRKPAIIRSRARASRGCSSRTRGSRRTARSTGPPGGEDGDPDPPGLRARTGRAEKLAKLLRIGGSR